MSDSNPLLLFDWDAARVVWLTLKGMGLPAALLRAQEAGSMFGWAWLQKGASRKSLAFATPQQPICRASTIDTS